MIFAFGNSPVFCIVKELCKTNKIKKENNNLNMKLIKLYMVYVYKIYE